MNAGLDTRSRSAPARRCEAQPPVRSASNTRNEIRPIPHTYSTFPLPPNAERQSEDTSSQGKQASEQQQLLVRLQRLAGDCRRPSKEGLVAALAGLGQLGDEGEDL